MGTKRRLLLLVAKKIELDKLNKFSAEEIEAKLNGKVETISLLDAVEILHKKQEIKVNSAYSSTPISFKASKLIGDGNHLQEDHSEEDFKRRMIHLLFAIDTAKTGKVKAQSLKRFSYTKTYPKKNIKITVIADEKGDVREVFTYFTEK